MSHNGRYVVHKLVIFCSREFVSPRSTPAFQFHGNFLLAGCFRKKKHPGISFLVCSSCEQIHQANTGNIFFSPTIMFGYSAADTHLCPSRTITGKFELIKFIAVGNKGYIISPTKTQQVGTNDWNAIDYGNGRYVVVGNKGSIAYSSDGTNWTMITVGKENIYDVKFLNGRFTAVFWGSTVGYSTDGINWTTHKSDVPIGTNGINWANGRYVTVGESATISYSSDGVNWTTNKIGQITQYYSTVWKRVAYGNSRWVAVANNGELAYSIDGINWILLFKLNESYSHLNDVKFLNGRFILAGSGQGTTRVDQSTNGEDWSFVSPTNFDFFMPSSISFKNNTFIAVGSWGKYSISSDGINWTNPEEVKNKITEELNGICFMQ